MSVGARWRTADPDRQVAPATPLPVTNGRADNRRRRRTTTFLSRATITQWSPRPLRPRPVAITINKFSQTIRQSRNWSQSFFRRLFSSNHLPIRQLLGNFIKLSEKKPVNYGQSHLRATITFRLAILASLKITVVSSMGHYLPTFIFYLRATKITHKLSIRFML